RYRDKVTIDEAVRPLTTPPSTARLGVRDAFFAQDIFHGAQAGLTARLRLSSFFFDGRGTVALGQRLARVNIYGVTDLATAGGPATARGGLLASRGNIGAFSDEDGAFVAELGLRAGY